MRKYVSKHNLLFRDDSILFIETNLDYNDDLFNLFMEMESKFPVNVSSIKLDFAIGGNLIPFLRNTIEKFGFESRKVILPLLLDDIAALFLRAVFTGSPDFLVISGRLYVALKRIDNFVVPFAEIPIEEISVLHKGRYEEAGRRDDPYLRMLEELERDSPGIRFNLLRLSERAEFLRAIGAVLRDR